MERKTVVLPMLQLYQCGCWPQISERCTVPSSRMPKLNQFYEESPALLPIFASLNYSLYNRSQSLAVPRGSISLQFLKLIISLLVFAVLKSSLKSQLLLVAENEKTFWTLDFQACLKTSDERKARLHKAFQGSYSQWSPSSSPTGKPGFPQVWTSFFPFFDARLQFSPS